MKTFTSYPPLDKMPTAVADVVTRQLDLRTKLLDAQDESRASVGKVAQAAAQDIKDAADALAAGGDATVGTKRKDAAVKAMEAAERQVKALQAATLQVTIEADAVFQTVRTEALEITTTELDRTRTVYADAIDALDAARRGYSEAVELVRFANEATDASPPSHPSRTHMDVGYLGARVNDSALSTFRAEVAAPPPGLPQRYNAGHYASVVQNFCGRKIYSYASGDTLTLLESDADAAIAAMERVSDWQADGDGVSNYGHEPADHVKINRVSQVTDAQRAQSHWMTAR